MARTQPNTATPTTTIASLKREASTDPTSAASGSPSKRPRSHTRTPHVAVAHMLLPPCNSGDHDIWYPDGNVVIYCHSDGHAKWFKLYRTRLAQYCRYFEDLFSSPSANTAPLVDDCPVYVVPADVSCEGLAALIAMLERPCEFWGKPLTQDLAILLLKTAYALSCPVVFDLAKRRLSELWNGDDLPGDSPAETERAVSWEEAVSIINLARKYDVPEVVKRAFYEVLVSKDFWRAHNADSRKIDLPDDDIYRLREMRLYLNSQWPKFVIETPQTDEKGETKCTPTGYHLPFACEMQRCERKDNWLKFALDNEELETGALDPLRYNLVRRRETTLKKMWCQWCLQDKEETWNDLRAQWWKVIGESLGGLQPI
ncbi:hypothetical protein L226DRAFT_386900 [Lentinus tigrinus ALCF2SS1-7]|uniref:uncharacterized protein n=1 Tax=Lentinus tigrinus ALCF2SS1-7 TaxID=1328758 RepID=UPI00116613FC|nr:hypothetical protein L226DRAFT_386900 [Lentinus tigrinus ALCF2SS1-7]